MTGNQRLMLLLRERKLDHTVTRAGTAAREALATGIAGLDGVLDGGLPRGEMSEVIGSRSSGRSSLLCAGLAAVTSRGGIAALVDPLDMFDPESGTQAGIQLDRLLWVRGEAISRHPVPPARQALSSGRREVRAVRLAAADPWLRALDRAVKAVNLVLQAGGFDLVALDLGEVPQEAIRRLPFTTWFRLQRTIEGSRTACLLVAPAPVSRSPGGVTVELARAAEGGSRWSGRPGCGRLFLGLDIEARIVRARLPETNVCGFKASA